jgi:hypothetical protein
MGWSIVNRFHCLIAGRKLKMVRFTIPFFITDLLHFTISLKYHLRNFLDPTDDMLDIYSAVTLPYAVRFQWAMYNYK